MRVAVMGAGAVGCFYGAMLARGGHDVVLIGRTLHMDAVRRDGLRFESGGHTLAVPMAVATDAAAARGADLVLFCVKATDTETAAAALQPHLAPGTLVWSLQNGIDNVKRLLQMPGWADLRPEAAVVYAAVDMAGPGHLRHHGRGELVLAAQLAPTVADGAAIGRQAWIDAFRNAGVPVDTVPSIDGALWAKLVLNCAYNALSAVVRMPYGPLMQQPQAVRLVDTVVAECIAVAEAEGIILPATLAHSVRRIPQTMPQQSSSTAQDLRRGRRTEIDHLNGAICRIGAHHGVPTPVNETLHALVGVLEGAGTSPTAI